MRYNKAIINSSGTLYSKSAAAQEGAPPENSADNSEQPNTEEQSDSAQKAKKGRGKASGDLRLSAEMLAVNKIMQEKFIQLRQAVFAAPQCPKQERIRQQRQFLAKALGVHEKLIRAIEKTPSTLPAAVIFALIKHYSLSPDYFMIRETALSEQFVLEQKIKEFEYKFTHEASSVPSSEKSGRNYSPEVQRRGGWLKGLPRKAKTTNDAHLLALWKEAKKRNFSPESVDDMLQWAKDNPDIAVDPSEVAAQKQATDNRTAKTDARKRGRAAVQRHGGWLLGLPRKPKTEEEKEQMNIWRIAKKHNLKFSSVKEMMAWWIVEGQKLTE